MAGLRFDKVRTSDWVALGNQVGNAYVQGQAAEAGKDASRLQTRTESTYGAMDPNAAWTGTGADGAMTNAEAASYGLNVPTENKAAGTGTTRQYGLGKSPATWQDKEFTPEQTRVAGLRGQADFYVGRGETDKADKINTQIDASAARERDTVRFGNEQTKFGRETGEYDRALAIRKIGDTTAQMPLAELETQAKQLNNNNSNYPFLYLRQGKGGYTFMSKDPDGTPGKEFTLNEAQVRQLAHAHALGSAGYGVESMTALSAVHKDIADVMKNWNATTAAVATNNNTATRGANGDANDTDRLAVAREQVGVSQRQVGVQERAQTHTENKVSDTIRDVEKALGVPLSMEQKKGLAGLGAEETAHMKALTAGLTEGLKSGALTPEKFEAKVNELFYAPKRAINEAKIVDGLRDAHKTEGSEGSQAAVNKLLAANYTPAQVTEYLRRAGIKTLPATGAAPAGDKKLPSELGNGSAAAKAPPTNTAAPTAPKESGLTRTTDGGKTWTLDIPETVRDPSVPHYREIPNPLYSALGNKKFASHKEAEAAYAKSTVR